MVLLALCILPSSLATGCAPHDIRPQSTLIDARQLEAGQALATAAEAAWPSERWWTTYNDPQLNDLVALATAQSPTLRIAEARVRMAQGAALAGGAGLFPSVGADAHLTDTWYTKQAYKPVNLAGHHDWDNAALLSASYSLDLWGKEKAAYTAGLSALAAATAEARHARLVLETAVVRAYIKLSEQYALLNIARKTLAQRQGVLALTKKLLNAGMGTGLAVSQAEIPLPATRARILDLESSITITKQQIAALCAQGPGSGASIKTPSLSFAKAPGLPANLPAELAGRRPDITAARWRVEGASQGIVIAKAAFYPNINLSAAIGYISIGLEHFITATALNKTVGPAISLPIFQGGKLRGNLLASTAAYDAAVETYNQTVVDALSAIAGQAEQLRSLEKQATEADKALVLARRAYKQTEEGYRAGFTEYVYLLTAENSLLLEEERSAAIAARRLDAYAMLMRELGGGLVAPPKGQIAPYPNPFGTPTAPGGLPESSLAEDSRTGIQP